MLIRQRLARNRVSREVARHLLPISRRSDLIRLGRGYGGWWVPADLINKDSICYLAGVGKDTTFDEDLIDRFGCEVWAFDPTPESVEWIAARNDLPSSWHFMPVGLWTAQETQRFCVPHRQQTGSASITRRGNDQVYFEAACETLAGLMHRLGHRQVDLLKMDIEGAEGPVLRQMLSSRVRPKVLCIEFDQPEPPWRLARRVRELLDAGYELNQVETWNYTLSYSR